MRYLFYIIPSLIVSLVSIYTLAADFEGKTEFTHVDLQGTYSVTCFGLGETKTSYHQCRGYLLEPSNWSYFNHQPNQSVDRVTLSNINKKGKRIEKKSKWNQLENRSEEQINLWVWTVFQRPLLHEGVNNVTYSMSKNGREVESGNFSVNVNDGGSRTCRDRSTATGDMYLCDNYSAACDEYFYRENNCLYE